MTWNLFIDDEREIADVSWAPWQVQQKYRDEKWVICRNMNEVFLAVGNMGMPSYISFDHDLGYEESTRYEIAKMLVDWDMNDSFYTIPESFGFYVHSKNPIGKTNIESYLDNYLKFRDKT